MNTLFDYLPWSQSELDDVQLTPGEQIGYVSPSWLTVLIPHTDGTYHTRLVMRPIWKQRMIMPTTRKKRHSGRDNAAGGMF